MDGSISTYRIEATTGRLQFVFEQVIGDVHALAGDPAGRYVYAAYGPRDRAASERQDASIVLHEADSFGRLGALSEASSRPWEPDNLGTECWGEGWTWLSASAGGVWGLWSSRYASFCHHTSYIGVSHAVTTGGQLGAPVIGDGWEDWGEAALDAEAEVLYKARGGSPGALTSHVRGPDGRLKTMGTTNLCVATGVWFVRPLAAVRGFVFGDRPFDGMDANTVCSWKGPRLAPQANLGFPAEAAAAFSPADKATPALLAMASEVHTPKHVYRHTDLRLLSMGSDGGVALLDTVELPSPVLQLLFEPSGRFLFVADDTGRLLAYSVSSGSGLEAIESVPSAAHPSHWTSPFLAISAQPIIPRL